MGDLSKSQIVDLERSREYESIVNSDNVIYVRDAVEPYWRVFGEPRDVEVEVVQGPRGEKVFLTVEGREKVHLYKYYVNIQSSGLKVGKRLTVRVAYRRPLFLGHTEENMKELEKKHPFALYHYKRMEIGINYSLVLFGYSLGGTYDFFGDYEKVKLYGKWGDVEELEVKIVRDYETVRLVSEYYGRLWVRPDHQKVIDIGYSNSIGKHWMVRASKRRGDFKTGEDFIWQVALVGTKSVPYWRDKRDEENSKKVDDVEEDDGLPF